MDKKWGTIETISPRPQGPDLSVRFQPRRAGIKVIFPITIREELTISWNFWNIPVTRIEIFGSVRSSKSHILRSSGPIWSGPNLSTGCPKKNDTLFWRAVAPLNFELGIKVGGVLESSGSQL